VGSRKEKDREIIYVWSGNGKGNEVNGRRDLEGVRDLSISHSKIMWDEVFIGWKMNYVDLTHFISTGF